MIGSENSLGCFPDIVVVHCSGTVDVLVDHFLGSSVVHCCSIDDTEDYKLSKEVDCHFVGSFGSSDLDTVC